MAAEEQQQRRRRRPPHPAAGAAAELPRGPLHDLPWRCSGRDGDPPPPPPPPSSSPDAAQVRQVTSTAGRYLANAAGSPSNPRYRRFRMGNRVSDRIAAVPGGVALLERAGFRLHWGPSDLYASIPLAADLGAMQRALDVMRGVEEKEGEGGEAP